MLGFHAESSHTMISLCLSVNLKTDSYLKKKKQHPINIMVFGVVTNNSDVMSPFIFQHGLRLNTEPYV